MFYKLLYENRVLMLSLFFLLITSLVINRDVFWFDGDEATVGIYIRQVISKNPDSWYFYGQHYFGVTSFLVNSFFVFWLGNLPKILRFCEVFWYGCGLYMLNTQYKFNSLLALLSSLFILYFPHRLYYWTFSSTGWGFMFFLSASAIVILSKLNQGIENTNKRYRILVLIGFLSTFGLYQNLILIFILPVSLIIILFRYLQIKHFVLYLIGCLLGIIPFFIAYLYSDGQNVHYFLNNSSDNKLLSINYVIQDFFYYFLRPEINFFSIRNITGVFLLLLLIYHAIKYFTFKRYPVLSGSLLVFLFMLFSKDYYNYHNQIPLRFEFIRYLLIPYTFFIFGILHSIDSKLTKFSFKFLSSYILLSLLLVFSLNIFLKEAFDRTRPDYLYDIIIKDLNNFGIEHLYCEDFYFSCSNISYFSEGNIKVEPTHKTPTEYRRVPHDYNTYKDGEKKYKLIFEDSYLKNQTILETYNTPELPKKMILVVQK